ncbi:hypothetical protein L6452_09373 [Arctium lappa]|uniref:Uncharacterized protein n=1 Tax=Arctium lappa TaxID=4217 RepID=A0ACB9DKE5_ARCLA|nr:hypothetical protein L6452_09373 [Arctium lappa]
MMTNYLRRRMRCLGWINLSLSQSLCHIYVDFGLCLFPLSRVIPEQKPTPKRFSQKNPLQTHSKPLEIEILHSDKCSCIRLSLLQFIYKCPLFSGQV